VSSTAAPFLQAAGMIAVSPWPWSKQDIGKNPRTLDSECAPPAKLGLARREPYNRVGFRAKKKGARGEDMVSPTP
jgi:hypothetical protein